MRGIGKITVVILGVLASALICYFDYRTGPNISYLIFYFVPLLFVLWYAGSFAGISVAMFSAVAWIVIDRLVRHPHARPFLADWNWFRAGIFILVAYLLSFWKSRLDQQHDLAFEDPLTGLANRRSFAQYAEREIQRATRYGRPLTVAFVDVDDFKKTNDTLGHDEGDHLLCAIGDVLRANLRAVDLAARLGGDEFAILLPDIGSDHAQTVIEKLHEKLTEATGQSGKWPVTFSVGGVSFETPPASVEAMLREADRCMYNAKNAGKNSFSFKILPQSNRSESHNGAIARRERIRYETLR